MSDPIGCDIDIQVSTATGEELLTGIVIDARKLSDGSAELDICLADGDVATISMSARQYAGFLGTLTDELPPPN
jgi:hypothetical protein